MSGRKPKPTAMKELEGNPGKRKLNKKEPIPEIVIFIMSLVFLRATYSKYLGSEEESEQVRENMLKGKVIADTM